MNSEKAIQTVKEIYDVKVAAGEIVSYTIKELPSYLDTYPTFEIEFINP